MKITVLLENTSFRENLTAEHGLGLYIETKKHRLLMDTGASALTRENAEKLGIRPEEADTVIISHGHHDHAGGLLSMISPERKTDIYMRASAGGDFYHGEKYIGIDKRILALPRLHLTEEPLTVIDDELTVFSGIPGRRLWPQSNLGLCRLVNGSPVQDDFSHEQCLVISENGKKVLLSGCAHNGILNILDRFFEIYGSYPDAVLSGFHMMKPTDYTEEELANIRATAEELKTYPTVFYTGHCTGAAIEELSRIMTENLHPMHVGDVIEP